MQNLPSAQVNSSNRIPRALKQFLTHLTQKHPDNLLLFNIAFTPMEPSEWCLIWIPRIYPNVQIPMPDETRKPLGYLAACQDILSYLTGYSRRSVEKWLSGEDCKYIVKRYLRLIHIFWTFQRFLNLPLALIKSLEPGQIPNSKQKSLFQ